MLLQLLLADLEPPTPLLQQLSGMLEGVSEEVGSLLLYPLPPSSDPLHFPQLCKVLFGFIPQLLYADFLFSPALVQLGLLLASCSILISLSSFPFPWAVGLPIDFAKPLSTFLKDDLPKDVNLVFGTSSQCRATPGAVCGMHKTIPTRSHALGRCWFLQHFGHDVGFGSLLSNLFVQNEAAGLSAFHTSSSPDGCVAP